MSLRIRERQATWLAAELAAGESLSPRERRRRRIVVAIALVAGAATLAWSLRIPPGDPSFIPSTLVLAAVWIVGAFAGGRPVRGAAPRPARRMAAEALLGLAVGLALLLAFLLGAGLVADVPLLRDPVQALLAHAHWGALLPVIAVAVLSGIGEELFFRGALADATAGRWSPLITTLAYTAVTACAGVVLLAFAAFVLGAACAALRRATGAFLAPTAGHLAWSIGMILWLEPALDLWR